MEVKGTRIVEYDLLITPENRRKVFQNWSKASTIVQLNTKGNLNQKDTSREKINEQQTQNMFYTIVGYCKKPDPPITQSGAPD